jgi:hypothetical protein
MSAGLSGMRANARTARRPTPGTRNRAVVAGTTDRSSALAGAALDAATTESAPLARHAAISSPLAPLAVPKTWPSGVVSSRW